MNTDFRTIEKKLLLMAGFWFESPVPISSSRKRAIPRQWLSQTMADGASLLAYLDSLKK